MPSSDATATAVAAPGVGAVLMALVRHPVRTLVQRWNWKAAVTSALIRGAIFFAVNRAAGPAAAWAALTTELWFRLATSGFYGAMTEAFRRARPAWLATVTVMVLLPIVSHSLELFVHWQRGTAKLGASVIVSIAFTSVSTAFNLFAMRRGALIVGHDSAPLWRDLARMPFLLAAFAAAPIVIAWKRLMPPDHRCA